MAIPSKHPIFVGTFWQRFDQKQRISVPSKWLLPASQTAFFLAWPHEESYLRVFPAEFIEDLLTQKGPANEADDAFAEAREELLGHAFQLIPDQQRRITLDSALVEAFPLDSQIALAGRGNHFAIYNAKDLKTRRAERPFLFNSALSTLESYRHES